MADDQINVDIVANDEASDKVDKVADAVEKLEGANPEIKVTADTGSAEANLKDAQDEIDRLIKADATIVIEAKIDAAKGNIRELKNELDTLKGGGDGSAGSAAKGLQTDLDGVTDSTNRAKDAAHGFAGEAVSELPGVGQALGPASEAVGQLTEGLLAGEIGFKQLIAAAGPIAGITIALKLISDELARIDKIDAFHEERVDELTDSLRDAKDGADGLRDSLLEAERIEFITTGGDVRDAIDSFVKLGIGVDDYIKLIEDGQAGIDRFKATFPELSAENERLAGKLGETGAAYSMLEFGDEKTKAYTEAILALEQGLTDYTGATEAAADKSIFFDGSAEDAATTIGEMASESSNAAGELKTLGDRASGAAHGVDEVTDSFGRLRGELSDRSSYLDVVDSLDTLKQKAEEAFYAGISGAADAEQKQRDYERALIDTKGKVIDYGDEVANLPTEVTTSIIATVDGARGQVEGLVNLLDQVERQRVANVTINTILNQGNSGSLYGRQ